MQCRKNINLTCSEAVISPQETLGILAISTERAFEGCGLCERCELAEQHRDPSPGVCTRAWFGAALNLHCRAGWVTQLSSCLLRQVARLVLLNKTAIFCIVSLWQRETSHDPLVRMALPFKAVQFWNLEKYRSVTSCFMITRRRLLSCSLPSSLCAVADACVVFPSPVQQREPVYRF